MSQLFSAFARLRAEPETADRIMTGIAAGAALATILAHLLGFA